MKFSKATPAERAALVRMVAASVRLIVVIGRAIVDSGLEASYPMAVNDASVELVTAIMEVSEATE